MPLVLPADVQTAVARRFTDVVYLLELELWQNQYGAGAVPLTLRCSDRSRQLLNAEWLPLVESFPDLGDVLAPPAASGGYAIAGCDVVLRNHLPVGGQARFTDLIRSRGNEGAGAYDGAFGNAKLLCVFGAAAVTAGIGFGQGGFGTGSPFGGVAGSSTGFFIPVRLKVDECVNVTEESCTLRMSGIEGALEDLDRLPRITTDRFPFADPDAIDQVVYLPIGPGLRGIPALGVISGIVHKLAGDIEIVSLPPGGFIGVSDPALVARMPNSGTLQIDEEQFTYTARDVNQGVFLNVTPGAFGTTRGPHKKGSAVFQVLSAYEYLCGWNPGAHRIPATAPRVYFFFFFFSTNEA